MTWVIFCRLCKENANKIKESENIQNQKNTDVICPFHKYCELPENTADILFLGSSHMFVDFNPTILYEEYGIAAYTLGGSVQPMWKTYHYLMEALKTQFPRLIALMDVGDLPRNPH